MELASRPWINRVYHLATLPTLAAGRLPNSQARRLRYIPVCSPATAHPRNPDEARSLSSLYCVTPQREKTLSESALCGHV
jgi:hypothetical protein